MKFVSHCCNLLIMLIQGILYKMDNWIAELEKLGNLRDQGILTEEEFPSR